LKEADMSTSVAKTQGSTSTAESRLSNFKEENAMRYAMPAIKLNKGLVSRTAMKLLGGLALGALLAMAAVLPFGPAYADEPARPFTIEQIEDLPGFMQTEVWLPGDTYPASAMTEDSSIVEETVLPGRYREAPVSAVRRPIAARPLSNREMDHIDLYMDESLLETLRGPVVTGPFSNKEIDRLNYQIDMLLAKAAHDPSTVGPRLNREIEHLDYQIDVLLRDLR
jgi:hypothetical protein